LFHSPDVLTTGVLSYNSNRLSAGKHQLTIEVLGAHPEAIKAYMVGLDYVKLIPEKEK